MIRILQVVSNMDRAGIETMLMNYYRHIDRNQVQFDFLCNKTKPGDYDAEILAMGGRIFHTPGLNPFKYIKYLRYMKQLFKEHPEYKIIHAHNDAFVAYSLYAAKRNNIPVRISHVHSAAFTLDYKWPLKVFCRFVIPSVCTHKWACGRKAGEFYYGKGLEFHVHNNAIEIEKFVFNADIRSKLRKEYGLEDKLVLGHVGRFMWQKNHSYLIEIFACVFRQEPKARLVLLGEGSGMDAIKAKVARMGLSDAVLFIGNVNNTREWYQAFDMFIMPSFWEGLPVTGIEAQAADLPCIFSDTITDEVKVLDSCKFMSIKGDPGVWAEEILRIASAHVQRKDRTMEIRNAGYDIEIEADKFLKIYKSLLRVMASKQQLDKLSTCDMNAVANNGLSADSQAALND